MKAILITLSVSTMLCLSCSTGDGQKDQSIPTPPVEDILEFDKPLTFEIINSTDNTDLSVFPNSQSPDGSKFVIIDEVDPTAAAVLIHLGSVSITPAETYTSQSASWSWSPGSRFVAATGEDTYAGFGLSNIIIIDSDSRRFTEIKPNYFAKGINIGQREMYKMETLGWLDDNTLQLSVSVDYLGKSGHPGINENRKNQLGDKFGTSDPLLIGTFNIRITDEPETIYVTTKLVEHSQIPIVIDPKNPTNETIARINEIIRFQFELTENYKFNSSGWGQVVFEPEIDGDFVSIQYSGVYRSAYPTEYNDQSMLFSLISGKEVISQLIPFRNFFLPESYQKFLNAYWLDDVRPKFKEATNCAGMEPNCNMEDIQSYKMTPEGLEISLTSDCYPHAASSCTPVHNATIALNEIETYLNELGKLALLTDGYSSMTEIEKIVYENKFESLISSSLANLESWDTLTVVGTGIIYRTEEVIKAIDITGFKTEVEVGEMVQIFPLRPELPVLELAITDVKIRDEIDYIPVWYEIELEGIESEEFRSIKELEGTRPEYPSDFLVVYPSIASCSRLFPQEYDPGDLPEGVTLDQVKGALDFDSDSSPDAVVTEYCCKEEADGGCDYTCGETYIRSGLTWYLITSSTPL